MARLDVSTGWIEVREGSTLQELQEQLDAEQHSSSCSLLMAAAVASSLGLSLAGLAMFYCCKFRRERLKKLLAEQSAKTVLRGTNKVIVERQDSGEVVGPVWLIGQGGWPPAHDTPSADPSACAVGV